jgi:hypothetical protein
MCPAGLECSTVLTEGGDYFMMTDYCLLKSLVQQSSYI